MLERRIEDRSPQRAPAARSSRARARDDLRLAPASALHGHIRLRTLVMLRWLAVFGQTAAVTGVYFGLGFELPLGWCLAAIAASAWLNIVSVLAYPASKRLNAAEAAAYLAYDILQLTTLLALTGGALNPFTLLFIAPVTISAHVLPLRMTVALGALTFGCLTFLAFVHLPLPWEPAGGFDLPFIYAAGIWISVALGAGFAAVYAWRIAHERARMSEALAATQLILAREQRLTALGGLAAAAAHELGTPLGTIHLIAKEMMRELAAEHPLYPEAEELARQAERCREILGKLAARREEGDALHERLSLGALLQELCDESPETTKQIKIAVAAFDDSPPPLIARRPEILYGFGSLLANALDYARAEVEMGGGWSAREIRIWIRDDGPGFAPEILPRLGEPYVTTRPQGPARGRTRRAADRIVHEGMGLGFFIAKTLLEHTGATISFRNQGGEARPEGAEIMVIWPRAAIEVEEFGGGAAGGG